MKGWMLAIVILTGLYLLRWVFVTFALLDILSTAFIVGSLLIIFWFFISIRRLDG